LIMKQLPILMIQSMNPTKNISRLKEDPLPGYLKDFSRIIRITRCAKSVYCGFTRVDAPDPYAEQMSTKHVKTQQRKNERRLPAAES
jgi:hypothetical protein